MGVIAVFDFLSHPHMHLPFNEGYLKVLRSAFPEKEIVFAACQGHIDNLKASLGSTEGIAFVPVEPLSAPAGKSLHHPWVGRRAARACFAEARRVLGGRKPEFAALCGMDANLLAVFRKAWAASYDATLHYVLHNHLAAAAHWRSRNPLLRAFDFASVFAKALPPGQSILVLELGLADTIEQYYSVHRGRVVTLEHPVVETEAAEPILPLSNRPLRIGFCGHCGRGKGFDIFVELATEFTGPQFEFHAIGLANPNASDLDLSSLVRKPSPVPVPREEFLAALRAVDLVCLPLPHKVSFVASGSIIDAFAAAKPLLLTANQMHQAIRAEYGDFGLLFADTAELRQFFVEANRVRIEENYSSWIKTIIRIREARGRQPLARAYAATIQMASAP